MNNEEKRVYAEYLNLIGWYYLKSPNYQRSIEYFRKANKSNPRRKQRGILEES